MKVKIILEAKEDFGCTLKGNRMTLINEIFCPQTGIAFFNIDYKQWEVISYNQFTGILDNTKQEVYNSDYIECESSSFIGNKNKNKNIAFGSVIFYEGAFCVDIIEQIGNTGYDIGDKIPLFDFINIKIKSI